MTLRFISIPPPEVSIDSEEMSIPSTRMPTGARPRSVGSPRICGRVSWGIQPLSKTRPGVRRAMSSMSLMPAAAMSSSLNTEMLSGMSCTDSVRFRAVTTISSMSCAGSEVASRQRAPSVIAGRVKRDKVMFVP